jgi:predicted ester cyclase
LRLSPKDETDVIDEAFAPDFVDHGTIPPGMPPGPEGVKGFVAAVRNAFPDPTITINHSVAEGDLVALRITSSATMKGDFAGMTPSGKHATWDAVHISRIVNGKVVEHWAVQDQLGILQQLGFVPISPADPAG